jgi:DNA repair protein RecN (Recombination protein N)
MSRGIEIHEKRQQVLDGLSTSCLDLLSKLGMPKAQLQFKLEKITIPDKFGISKVQLLFSANAGQEVRELSKVASGGEFSRLMLSLKKILAETADLPTIIFDEIDTGVSGAIADKMGEVLSSLSKHLQVLVITHLPQIAGKGNDHLKVMKWEENNQTISRLCRLESPDRVNEIAAMLSGTELTDAARTHAKSLLGF